MWPGQNKKYFTFQACATGLFNLYNWLFQKISKQGGGLRIYFFDKPPGIFHFFTLPLEIPDKTKLNPWIFHKIVIDSLDIHIIFSWSPLQIPPHF